ncbi:MAG: SRPBCC domain-containing protein [Solirubrobacterales bacterium]|nr:SRPBCC domain-containing protein [Solirubrobacterales bacterium]
MSEPANTIEHSAEHASFTIERDYPATPKHVFAAWAQAEAKNNWFARGAEHSLDFAIGGAEHLTVSTAAGETYTYDARYYDIVENERIVYAYEMHRDETRISVTVTTVLFEASAEGTHLRYIEQGVFLDGQDTPAAREHGTRELLDSLGETLRGEGEGA